MKTRKYTKWYFVLIVMLLMTTKLFAQVPAITGITSVCTGSTGITYSVPAGMLAYNWSISGGGTITSLMTGDAITVDWTSAGLWDVSVNYTDPVAGAISLLSSVTVYNIPVPSVLGPLVGGLPATLGGGVTTGQVYSTEPGMSGYQWTVSPTGTITAGAGTDSITVTWTNPTAQQFISVNYANPGGCMASMPSVFIINYYPFAVAIDPTIVPQFVDPLPHFAAGLRVNAKAGGNLLIKTVPVQQIALSTGTVLNTGIIGDPATPNAGKGNYAAYAISKDNGLTFGPAMWPAQTIEAQQGNPLSVQYRNDLFGVTYDNFNILADQTLMMNGYRLNGDPLTEPYRGEIPMVVHLHGGEIPSNSDGGPNGWFTPGYSQLGPAFQFNASSLATYPNQQEAATLWYHPHDDGLTRINVYTGLAGFYFIRGADEEAANLPGWSGDDLVQEMTPTGKTPTFNGTNAYLPEIEIAIQDRMFNVNGELYWPVAPPNPEIHPFWTPEFVGDIMTVNGKAWPYLSVAPRKYRFHLLEGCNARFLNMWLVNAADGTPGPVITVVGGEGGLLASPATLDPALGQTLLMAPGQRYDVVVDFTGIPAGTTFTLMNNAGAPYPFGDPVIPGITDRIMQFVVNGVMVPTNPLNVAADKSLLPANLRPVTPLVKLTDFSGGISAGVLPDVKRQIVLNEVSALGGPAAVLINNSYFDAALSIAGDPYRVGGPSELQREGTTEMYSIINISADAHPIHIHLLQWQLVSRQAIDDIGYMNAYAAAWASRGIPEFPVGLGYPGGAGTPFRYDSVNADGAIGGNPAVSPFLVGPVIPADPEEHGWKDNIRVMPGEVTTFIVRVAPTDKPINATQQQLLFPFDPSEGPGYVWHCHIIDHEDMSMMRPLMILPSVLRYPQITLQPTPLTACAGDAVSFSVAASSASVATFRWQISTDGGFVWTNLTDTLNYLGSATASLLINAAALIQNSNQYRCVITNFDGAVTSNAATLAVNNCSVSGTVKYNNPALDPLVGFTVTVNGISAVTDATGAFAIPAVTSGVYPVTVSANLAPTGSINSTDAGKINSWVALPIAIPDATFLSGDVDNDLAVTALDAQSVVNNFVKGKAFLRTPWSFGNAAGSGIVNPAAMSVSVNGTPVTGFNIQGMCTGDFNGSYSPLAVGGTSNVLLTNGLTVTVPSGKQFILALRSAVALQTGAISLVLNIPSNLVIVKNVTIPGSTGPVTFNTVGNELRIGWNSTVPVNILAGGDLVVLTLMPTTAFTNIQTMIVGLVANPLNEVADGAFNTIPGVNLTVDNVTVNASANLGNSLKLDAFPNPATVSTTVVYQIPANGTVTLGLYNAQGLVVLPLVNATQLAGNYSLNVDVSSLLIGTYYLKITLLSGTKIQTKSIKFIKQ